MPQLEDRVLKLDQAVNSTFTETQLVKLLEWRLDQLTRLDGRKYHLYNIYIFEREHLHLNLILYLFPASGRSPSHTKADPTMSGPSSPPGNSPYVCDHHTLHYETPL